MSFNIVPFNKAYQNQIVDLILPIQQNEFNVPITLNDQPDLLNIPSFYQKNAGNFWLALDQDKVIGSIALIDIGYQQTALRKMFVAKEYRGTNFGVAKLLLDTVIEWCRKKQIKEIYLGTVAILVAAQHFYEKNGFIEITAEQLPINFPRMAVDTKFYQLSL